MAPKSCAKVVTASLCRPPTAAANDEWFKECFECGRSEQRERRLLESWVVKARRHGTAPHRVVSWVRRKVGSDVVVWRQLADGSLGCAAPCVFCQRELQRFGMRVHCREPGGGWFSGRLDDPQARPPAPRLTSQQRKALRRDPEPQCPLAQREQQQQQLLQHQQQQLLQQQQQCPPPYPALQQQQLLPPHPPPPPPPQTALTSSSDLPPASPPRRSSKGGGGWAAAAATPSPPSSAAGELSDS